MIKVNIAEIKPQEIYNNPIRTDSEIKDFKKEFNDFFGGGVLDCAKNALNNTAKADQIIWSVKGLRLYAMLKDTYCVEDINAKRTVVLTELIQSLESGFGVDGKLD